MLRVKISCWRGAERPDISHFVGGRDNEYRDCRFFINDNSITEADCWIVQDNTLPNDLTCRVPRSRLYFCTGEVALKPDFWTATAERRDFLSHFGGIFSNYDIPGAVKTIPWLGWFINGNHGTSGLPHRRDLAFYRDLNIVDKPREISMFCSAQAILPSHVERIKCAVAIHNHFKGRVHWYGNRVNPIPEKWDGIAPYRYTIAMENQQRENVITEKLMDCYLGLSYPIYGGAPNVGDYFDRDAFTPINVADPENAIRIIEDVLAKDFYKDRLPALRKTKDAVTGKYFIWNRLADLATQATMTNEEQEVITLPYVDAPCWPH